ncbi:hypothetical protein [Plantibacter flavus]|uniref:hypothetical protein n=1 Tax=Plantibacter flavus TaxID=150123 RepID=UPI00129477F6|nr:hypothetical protein [Plantibacter flavus]
MSNLRRTIGIAGVGALCASALLGGSSAAFAEDQLPYSDVLAAVEAVVPETLDAAAPASSTDADAAQYSAEGTTVTVPWDASRAATLNSASQELTVSLPFAQQASDGVLLHDGVTAFDNGNASTTVPVVRGDGSLQIITVIDGAQAPTRYDYDFSVPEGGALTIREDGVVIITDASGGFSGGVAPAWAKDATGAPVSTWYEVSGNTLTQVVDHSAETAYPVVADPWAGITLFQNFKRDSYKGDYRYSAWVTPLGAVVLSGGGGVGGYIAGQAVFNGAGWDEWKSRFGATAMTNKATLKHQYNCHVAASVYGLPFTQDYNLERFRTNRSNWPAGVVTHRCNW